MACQQSRATVCEVSEKMPIVFERMKLSHCFLSLNFVMCIVSRLLGANEKCEENAKVTQNSFSSLSCRSSNEQSTKKN